MRRRFFIYGCLCVLLCSLLFGGWLLHRHYANPFPAGIRKTAVVSLWYPTQLPGSITPDPHSFSQRGNVVLYDFNAVDTKLHFTLQRTAPAFNFDQFYSKTLTNAKTITTPNGTAHIGNMGPNTVASMVVGDTWVMAIYNQRDFSDELVPIMQSLHRY